MTLETNNLEGSQGFRDSPLAPRPSSLDAVGRLARLVRKELSEILRDRRTIITLVLMPLLLYPLLSIAFQQFLLASKVDPESGPAYRFGFATEVEEAVFAEMMKLGERALHAGKTREKSQVEDERVRPRIESGVFDNPDAALKDNQIDVVVRIPDAWMAWPLEQLERDVALDCEFRYLKGSPGALGALAFVEQRLAAKHSSDLEKRLRPKERRFRPALLVRVQRDPIEQPGADGFISLHALVPLILILMTITGAVYPAIDLTAGERERGTLEILVAAPVPRLGLLFAKYVTVVTVAVLTALVNLVTMWLTLTFSGLGATLLKDVGFSPLLLLQLFGLLLLFAAFFSAVLLSLTSFARSFKEAQAYLIPLMLASLGPGVIGMLPGLRVEGPLAVVPLLNIVLLARDLFQGGADPLWALVVVLSTLVYAAAAIALAARVFGAEGVLYNDQSGWADLIRRPSQPQEAATPSAALWCLALMLPAHFTLQWLGLQLRPLFDADAVFVISAAAAVVLFLGLPALSAFFGRVRWSSGFGFASPRFLASAGGLALGLSLWPWVLQLLAHLHAERGAELREHLAAFLVQAQLASPVLLAATFGIQAAVEELYFRGYLFAALRRHMPAWMTITVTALLFGFLHVVMGGAFGWERLLPSTLMGFVLGWVRWRSGSVWPCIVLHVSHNVLLNLAPRLFEMSGDEVSAGWLAAGAVGAAVGSMAVFFGKPRNE
ncbi:MAG: ABC transporter permease subunit [Gemmataceae bacterium]|nr:ABC transporter permease subunit [Gemmataceae bacterium]